MFRVLFLIFIIVNSFSFLLAEIKDSPLVFAEVRELKNNNLKKVTDDFLNELNKEKHLQGYIITYGTDKETTYREKIIKNAIAFRKFDVSRINIIRGGKIDETKTIFYLIPNSDSSIQTTDKVPIYSISEAKKIDEFETATNGDVKMRMDNFYLELNNDPSATAYIINYGTPKEVAKREKQIRDSIIFRKYDGQRIVFVQGGLRKIIKTELWIVPAGATPPQPSDDARSIEKSDVKFLTDALLFETIGVHSDRFYQWVFGEFFNKLNERADLNGYILINAGEAEFRAFEEKIRKFESFAKINSERIYFVKGKLQTTMSSELWLVPKGAELPGFESPKAEKFDEFGKLNNTEWRKRMKKIGKKINEIKYDGSQLFIINYGTEKEISVAEQLIHRFLYENCRECFGYSNLKITYLRGGSSGKARRVFWIVPEGAEPPKP